MRYSEEKPHRSEKQAALIRKLTLSSSFTSQEVDATLAYIDSPACTIEKASRLIDRAFARINGRNDSRKASEQRRELYHAAKAARAAQAEVAANRAFTTYDNVPSSGTRQPQPADVLFD